MPSAQSHLPRLTKCNCALVRIRLLRIALFKNAIPFMSLILHRLPVVTKRRSRPRSCSLPLSPISPSNNYTAPHISAMVAACSASERVCSCLRSGEASALWKDACLIGDLALGEGGPNGSIVSIPGAFGAGTGESGGDSHSDSAAVPAASLTSSISTLDASAQFDCRVAHAAAAVVATDDALGREPTAHAEVSADNAPAASSETLFLLQRFCGAFRFLGLPAAVVAVARLVPEVAGMGAPAWWIR